MAKCPKCNCEAESCGFDENVEMRIAYCTKCHYKFYETGLMFTCNTALTKRLSNQLNVNEIHPNIDQYHDCLKALQYENKMRLYWIENFLALNHHCSILDVGCGYGNIPILFAMKYGVKRAAGVDVNPEYVNIGQRKVKKLRLNNIQFNCGSIYQMPYRDQEFSHIVCAEALEHLARPRDALLEMRRVTYSTLVIQIPTPNPLLLGSVGKLYEWYSRQKVYHVKSRKLMQTGEEVYPFHVFEPSSIEFLNCLKSSGWKVERYVGTRLLPVPFSLFHQKLMKQILTYAMEFNDYKLSKIWPLKLIANQLIIKATRL